VITLNDILEALVGMHQIFYRDEFQLVEKMEDEPYIDFLTIE
jgi:CBS domain containing-hemolysin-like protein